MHPPEPIYPCYLPVLGEFNRMTPHEGPSTSLPEVIEPSESASGPWWSGHAPRRSQGLDMPLASGGHVPRGSQGLDIVGLCPTLARKGGHVQWEASANRSPARS